MLLFYNLAIFFYGFIIRIAALFNAKAKAFVSGRKNVWKQLGSAPKENVVWFHAASLGEFEQGKPVMEALKKAKPEINLVVTFFSPSGYAIRKNYESAFVLYLPLDTPRNARRFVNALNPKLAVFIRYEFWANYLDALAKANIPTTVIAAQFRANQFLFSSLGGFIKSRLQNLSAITVQYATAKDVLLQNGFGPDRITVCGDSRFDRVLETVKAEQEIPELKIFCGTSPTLILGSCYENEVDFVKDAITSYPDWKFILAPHFVDDAYVSQLEKRLPEKSVRFTAFSNYFNERILVLNTIGKLAAAYNYGEIAVIGGGFRDGIHNIIEPAAFGLPVFFGPNHHKFPEAQAMINAGIGFEIDNQGGAKKQLEVLLANSEIRNSLQKRTSLFVIEQVGATNCIIEKLIPLLP